MKQSNKVFQVNLIEQNHKNNNDDIWKEILVDYIISEQLKTYMELQEDERV